MTKQQLQKPTPKAGTSEEPAGEGTPGTPLGAGRQYETEASGSGNAHGKASATPAGGDPVNSPVIGNPGEARRDIGYDYGLAAAHQPPSNPRAAVQPVQSVPMLVQVQQPAGEPDDTEYAERVRARAKGHYDGLREPGDVFNNTLNLPTFPEDPNSWIEDADKPPQEVPTPRELLRARKAKAAGKK